jgi:hypothetical protein
MNAYQKVLVALSLLVALLVADYFLDMPGLRTFFACSDSGVHLCGPRE